MPLQNFNEVILVYLNRLGNNNFIAQLVGIFADAPILFVPIFLIVTRILVNNKKDKNKKNDLLLIFYSTIIGITLSLIIQHFFHFDRPENYIQKTGKLLLKHIPDASFPSDHATVSFAFLTSLYYANYKKTAYIFLPFAVIMVLSRVIAGVHWPFDIVAGILIGIFSSYITFKFVKKLKFIKKLNEWIIKIAGYIKL